MISGSVFGRQESNENYTENPCQMVPIKEEFPRAYDDCYMGWETERLNPLINQEMANGGVYRIGHRRSPTEGASSSQRANGSSSLEMYTNDAPRPQIQTGYSGNWCYRYC